MLTGCESLKNKTFRNDNDNKIKNTYNQIRLLEPIITDDLLEFARNHNTSFTGLEYSVKTASSIEDKFERICKQDKNKDISIEMTKLKDIIRYTQLCEHKNIFKIAKETIEGLETKGYKLCAINNYYKEPFPRTMYKGLHLNFISPYGQIFELQIHSEESFKAKQEGHKLYEQIRSVSTPISVKEKLIPELQRIHSSIINPPDYEELNNYQMNNVKDYISALSKVDKQITYICGDTHDSISYMFTQNGNNIIKGFECTQSDGSIILARSINNRNAELITMSHNGIETSREKITEDIINKLTPKDINRIAKINEVSNNLWETAKTKREIELIPYQDTKSLLNKVIVNKVKEEKINNIDIAGR